MIKATSNSSLYYNEPNETKAASPEATEDRIYAPTPDEHPKKHTGSRMSSLWKNRLFAGHHATPADALLQEALEQSKGAAPEREAQVWEALVSTCVENDLSLAYLVDRYQGEATPLGTLAYLKHAEALMVLARGLSRQNPGPGMLFPNSRTMLSVCGNVARLGVATENKFNGFTVSGIVDGVAQPYQLTYWAGPSKAGRHAGPGKGTGIGFTVEGDRRDHKVTDATLHLRGLSCGNATFEGTAELLVPLKLHKGKMTLANKTTYEGSWDTEAGSGTLRRADGSEYRGTWKIGGYVPVPHGKGELTEAGSFYKGGFANGKKEGVGFFRSSDGVEYQGTWHEGMRSGSCSWKEPHGELLRGTYENDELVSGYYITTPEDERNFAAFRKKMKVGTTPTDASGVNAGDLQEMQKKLDDALARIERMEKAPTPRR